MRDHGAGIEMCKEKVVRVRVITICKTDVAFSGGLVHDFLLWRWFASLYSHLFFGVNSLLLYLASNWRAA